MFMAKVSAQCQAFHGVAQSLLPLESEMEECVLPSGRSLLSVWKRDGSICLRNAKRFGFLSFLSCLASYLIAWLKREGGGGQHGAKGTAFMWGMG